LAVGAGDGRRGGRGGGGGGGGWRAGYTCTACAACAACAGIATREFDGSRSGAVPVLLWVTEALAYRDHAETFVPELLEHEFSERVGGLVVVVMCNGQMVVDAGVAFARQVSCDVVPGHLDFGSRVVQVVFSVEVKVYDMVAQHSKEFLAVDVAAGIRRSHVLWEDT
jgi:hypothetical protein